MCFWNLFSTARGENSLIACSNYASGVFGLKTPIFIFVKFIHLKLYCRRTYESTRRLRKVLGASIFSDMRLSGVDESSARSPYDLVSVCLCSCASIFRDMRLSCFQVFGPCFNDLYSSWNFLVSDFRGMFR